MLCTQFYFKKNVTLGGFISWLSLDRQEPIQFVAQYTPKAASIRYHQNWFRSFDSYLLFTLLLLPRFDRCSAVVTTDACDWPNMSSVEAAGVTYYFDVHRVSLKKEVDFVSVFSSCHDVTSSNCVEYPCSLQNAWTSVAGTVAVLSRDWLSEVGIVRNYWRGSWTMSSVQQYVQS
jgi:hypothetical protein